MVFEKLYKFIGRNIKALVDRPDDPHCFRLHRQRVYYVREALMRRATCVARDKLVSLGLCVGRLTHSGKFRLTIGALDLLAQHAKYKVWVKPAAEMQFLYGSHLLKGGLGRISEAVPAGGGWGSACRACRLGSGWRRGRRPRAGRWTRRRSWRSTSRTSGSTCARRMTFDFFFWASLPKKAANGGRRKQNEPSTPSLSLFSRACHLL